MLRTVATGFHPPDGRTCAGPYTLGCTPGQAPAVGRIASRLRSARNGRMPARPLSRAWSSLIQGSGHRLRRWPSHRGGGKAGSGGATAIKARPRSPDRLRLLIGSTPINRTGVPDSPVPVPADTSRTCPFRGSTAELVLRTAATDPVRLLAPKAEGLLVSLTATELAYQPVSSLRRPGLPGGLGSRVRLDYWADDRRAAHSWSRMDISTSSYQRPSWSTDSRWRPSSTNPAFW